MTHNGKSHIIRVRKTKLYQLNQPTTILGVVPGIKEFWRLTLYVVISVFYIAFWLGVSILFSILFRGITTSALATLALWIFFSFFVSMGAGVMANAVVPLSQQTQGDPAMVMRHFRVQRIVSLMSPMQLYNDSTAIIIP